MAEQCDRREHLFDVILLVRPQGGRAVIIIVVALLSVFLDYLTCKNFHFGIAAPSSLSFVRPQAEL